MYHRFPGNARSGTEICLLDGTAPVGCQQLLEAVDLGLQLPSDVRIRHLLGLGQRLEDLGLGENIIVPGDTVLPALERLMGDELEAMGIVNQCIAGNAGGFLVGTAEAAVDDCLLYTSPSPRDS